MALMASCLINNPFICLSDNIHFNRIYIDCYQSGVVYKLSTELKQDFNRYRLN